jgi:DNA-binding response OmpR family regulator
MTETAETGTSWDIHVPGTILIVDDRPANLELIDNFLNEQGFTILVATSGKTALQRIAHTRPDIILLDIMMPGMDGLETCRKIKAHIEYKEIPVIFMTALTDPEHKVKGFEAGGVDYITKPVQKEELLARVNTHLKICHYREYLEKEVDQRTVELKKKTEQLQTELAERKKAEKAKAEMEKQLRQAYKMESIGTLASGIAHDFNNILFPIIGYAEMLRLEEFEDQSIQNGLNSIYVGALRARELIDQILSFSRQTEQELKLMKVDPIIKETMRFIRSSIPSTVTIKQNIQNGRGLINANPTQIHQIIMNLATNAYHAMEDDGGTLTITLGEMSLNEDEVPVPTMKTGLYTCLTVSDTGVGMDRYLIEKIFDPFFTTKKEGKGTGMGLSIVHGIVNSLNGDIRVDSEPGTGTTFYVYLPTVEAENKQALEEKKQDIQKGSEHILFVDDEQQILGMQKQMLEGMGYKVTPCISSLEAIETFRQNPSLFDLVITDWMLPELSGDKLAVELTSLRPDIPILLITGFDQNISDKMATNANIKGFLAKPILMTELSKKIREVLDTSATS